MYICKCNIPKPVMMPPSSTFTINSGSIQLYSSKMSKN